MKKNYIILLIATITLTLSCVEQIDIETKTFESVIVIEATITNEFKYQEIKLTRTFRFEDDGPTVESNADVKIVDDSQNIYNFIESEPGKYLSALKFSAQPNTNYELSITTNEGRSYASNSSLLTNTTQIDNVYALREINDKGVLGVRIFVDSFDPTGNSRYYRYTYEETYKIQVPAWAPLDAIIISDTPPFEVDTELRQQEERICFNTLNSNGTIQVETTNFAEDRVTELPIRFIESDDFMLRNRYSILVKQFVQSLEAFSFFKTLDELSSSESLFSQIQPGFLNGNVFSISNSNEKVLGFFEVSSVSEKRIFFNFKDIFPNSPFPPFVTVCGEDEIKNIELFTSDGLSSPLIEKIKTNEVKFFGFPDFPTEKFPLLVIKRTCGDCTILGSNVRPDFWIE